MIRCEECGRALSEADVHWLELNQRSGNYQTPGSVPDKHSQGLFPFGKRCALKVRKDISERILWQHDEWRVEERAEGEGSFVDILDGEGTIRITMDWLSFQDMVSKLYHHFYMT